MKSTLYALLVVAALPASAQQVTVGNGTLVLGSGTLFVRDSLVVQPSGQIREIDGYVTSRARATTTLAAPSAVNVGGLGFTITSAADPGATTVVRTFGVQGGNGNSSIGRTYAVSAATNTGLNATIVFRYRDAEINGLSEASLTLYRSTDGGTTWQEVGGTVDTDANTITATGVDGFSMWTAGEAGTLPVELVAFNAVADGNGARLAWTTAAETHNAGFYIEHLAGAWRELGFQLGRGTATERTDYTFDVRPLDPGRHTFRLRQVDTDGTVHLSPTTTVEIGMETTVRLDVRGRAVRYAVREGGPTRLVLYTVLGQEAAVLFDGDLPASALQTASLPGGLASGLYMLRLTGAGETAVVRVVVP